MVAPSDSGWSGMQQQQQPGLAWGQNPTFAFLKPHFFRGHFETCSVERLLLMARVQIFWFDYEDVLAFVPLLLGASIALDH